VLGGTQAEVDDVLAKGAASGKTNVIAEHAVALGDLRTLSPDQLKRAREAMTAVVNEAPLAQTQAALTFQDGYPALAPAPGNEALLVDYDKISQDLGVGRVAAVSPDRAGAADVSFISAQVPAIIDGIGLMGTDDHSPQETADLATLPSQTKRAALLLYRLAQRK
jgi:glutamate carboxypeptidase